MPNFLQTLIANAVAGAGIKLFGVKNARHLALIILDIVSYRNMNPKSDSALTLQVDVLRAMVNDLDEKLSKYPDAPPNDGYIYVLKDGKWWAVAAPGEIIVTDRNI